MMKLPKGLQQTSRQTRNYVQILACIYRRVLYNIYYDNILDIKKTEIINLMRKSLQMIDTHATHCARFLKAKGDHTLAAWIHFGAQQSQRLIKKFPSVKGYIDNMMYGDQQDAAHLISNCATQYHIRFLNNMRVTTPHTALRKQYHRIYHELSTPTPPQPAGVIYKTRHNRRRNLDLGLNKIHLINMQTGFI